MTPFRIRRLTSDDWVAYREIRLAALADAPSAFGSNLARELAYPDDIWRSRLDGSQSTVFAAEWEGRLVGLVGGLSTASEGTALLVSMWVAPEARRQGVGDALVQRVISWAEEAGYTRLELAVTVGNEAAERVYTRCGFVRTDPAEWGEPAPGHETLTMRRELNG